MKIKTFKSEYELIEFNHYIDIVSSDEPINILELTIDTNDIEYLEDELSNIFLVESGRLIHVFSDYEVSEYYVDNNGLVKVVCIR